MKYHVRFAPALALAFLAAARAQNVSDPHITTWLTAKSGQYARVYETAAKKSSGTTATTWPSSGLTNSGGGQATLAYADIQRVAYSSTYVYIQTTGFPSYTMGNWVNPQGGVFMFWPANRAAIHRIPRNPSIPTTKTKANGVGGVWLNGVYLWENGDAQSYITSSATVAFNGDGIWNRLAGVAEAFNFDPANGHQPSSGAYHTHINPIGLRYQLGDNVTYNSSTKAYSEGGTPTKHSPILGWALDGLPVYGPYGYSSALDATSGVRRMKTGFQKRDGTNGSTNLSSTGRHTLPVWAAGVQGVSQTLSSSQYGPSVNGTYPLGTFAEDYDYMGDLGLNQGTDFDLNRQNVRYCVTPEYPSGTYAYFVCIDSSGTTTFPDVINQEFYGSLPSGGGPNSNQGTVTSISEAVTEYADAGPAATISVTAAASGSNVALAWNSAEGATYKVESSPDNSNWSTLSSTVTSGGLTTNYAAATNTNYYRVTLTAIASYDTGGTYGTAVGKTATVLFGTPVTAPSITTQPANATVTASTSITFTVVASGTATLSYQWRKGSSAISGATSASYTIASPQTSDAGSYTVTVTNSAGSVTSSAATLTVNAAATAPSITAQPSGVSVVIGSGATFTVVAGGTAPLSYQWQKNGNAISGATSASYTIASTQAGDAGSYTVTVTNSAGSATSNAVTLAVNAAAPSITAQPASASVTAGGSATFTVAASGTAPLSYQWQKNGSAISGATFAAYTIASAQAGDAGSYSAVVTNGGGSVASNAATLTVTAAAVAPSITTQPSGASVAAGSSVTFTVAASGTAPLSYQWQKNSAAISGATSASFTIATAQASDAANYACVVTNSAGSATSNTATFTVTSAAVAPTITTSPVGASTVVGGSVTFVVAASGTAPLTYQWQKIGAAISGATGTNFTIASAQLSDAGSYTGVVTNSAGSATSAAAPLSVTTPVIAPSITTDPVSASVTTGTSVTLTVAASGTPPLSYQWQKNGSPIPGATATSYAIASAQSGDAANYTCVVTNSAGSATSASATLTVTAAAVAPGLTTQPVAATVNVGGAASFTIVASGTAPLSYQWQKNGTAIPGATAASYAMAAVQSGDAGSYVCTVTNSVGSITSSGATLTVTTGAIAPAITAQPPTSLSATTGGSVTFVVAASGTAPLSYQWRKDGAALPGATSASYTIAAVQTADIGAYLCVVTNTAGSATSAAATLSVTTVALAPTITTQPANVSTVTGGSASFTLVANGTAPLIYQWRKDGVALSGATAATYALAGVPATAAGSYMCVVTNSVGSATSSAATLVVTTTAVAPSITTQPSAASVTAGGSVTFAVTADGTAPLSYQWQKNGAPISGATATSYFLPSVVAGDAGSYTCVVINAAGVATSAVVALAVTSAPVDNTPVVVTPVVLPTPPAARIVNLAVRTRVGGVAGTPTIGFVLAGAGAGKRVIVRAVGPTLGSFGVAGALADPRLQLWSGGAMLASNDNWLAGDASSLSSVGAFPLVVGGADAAIVSTLTPGAYTTPVLTGTGASGIVLIECYDGAPNDPSTRLVNASALAYAGTGDDVLIPAFVISGEGTVRILVRAIGPGLGQFGLTNAISDPQLTLYRGDTAVAANNDWGLATNAAEVVTASAGVGAFALAPNSNDAALLVSLSAGTYSATVTGIAGAIGPALVEVYVVP